MRTVTRKVYSAAELKDASPTGFAFALRQHERRTYDDPAWSTEHGESLSAMLKAFGNDPPEWPSDTTRAQDIRRSMAWVENNILAPLRVPFRPIVTRKVTTRYGADYRPGSIKPCPFTGYCIDDALLDYVRKEARNGTSPRQLRREVEQEGERLWSEDVEAQAGEDAFLDDADANDREFYSDGTQA